MKIIPLTLKEACKFVAEHHRHNKPPVGHKFSIGSSLRAAGFRIDKELAPRKNWSESSVKMKNTQDAMEPSMVPRIRWVWS